MLYACDVCCRDYDACEKAERNEDIIPAPKFLTATASSNKSGDHEERRDEAQG